MMRGLHSTTREDLRALRVELWQRFGQIGVRVPIRVEDGQLSVKDAPGEEQRDTRLDERSGAYRGRFDPHRRHQCARWLGLAAPAASGVGR